LPPRSKPLPTLARLIWVGIAGVVATASPGIGGEGAGEDLDEVIHGKRCVGIGKYCVAKGGAERVFF
jgi:hypothetical protein